MRDVDVPVPNLGLLAHLERRNVPPNGLAETENWIYRDGEFQVRPGVASFGNNPAQRPMGYAQYRHLDGEIRTVKGTVSGWWKYNAGTNTWVNITGTALSGSPTQQQVFRVFQKAGTTSLLGTNEANTLKKWDGLAASYSEVGGAPPRARCMALSAERVLLANLKSGGTVSPVGVDVSAAQDFDKGWGTEQVSLLADTPGEIIGMMERGNLLTNIYKTDAIYHAIAVGAADPFRFELREVLEKDSGPCSTLAIIKVSEGLDAYLGLDGAPRLYDGVSRPVEFSRAASKWIKDNANFSTLGRAWTSYDPLNKELWFVFSEKNKTDPNLAAIIDPRTGIFHPYRWDTLRFSAGIKLNASTGLTIGELVGTIGTQELTIGEYAAIEPRMILGEIGGQSFKDSATNDNGAAITTFWESGLHNLSGLRRRFVDVQEIHHYFAKTLAAQDVTVKVGKSDYGEDRILSAGQTLAVGSDGPYKTGHRTSGRYMSQRVEANATQAIKYKGSSAVVVDRGVR